MGMAAQRDLIQNIFVDTQELYCGGWIHTRSGKLLKKARINCGKLWAGKKLSISRTAEVCAVKSKTAYTQLLAEGMRKDWTLHRVWWNNFTWENINTYEYVQYISNWSLEFIFVIGKSQYASKCETQHLSLVDLYRHIANSKTSDCTVRAWYLISTFSWI